MSRTRLAVALLTALGLAAGAAYVPLLATSGWAPDRGLWVVLDLVIGWGFVGAGAYAWLRRPDNRIGALMMATGLAWYLGVGERTDVPLLFTIGLLSNYLFAGAAIHLLLAFPSGRVGDAAGRALVALTYVAVTVGIWVPTLFLDPVSGLGCEGCPENLAMVESAPGFATTWLDALSVVGIALLAAVLAALVVRWRRATLPMRRAVTPVFAAGGALMTMLAVLLGAHLVTELPVDASNILYYATLAPFGAVPYVFLAGLVRARMLRGGAVGELVATLSRPLGPGDLRDALANALGDPSVDLAYWLPDSEQYVDAAGRRVDAVGGPGRAVHRVALADEHVAAIVYDPGLDDPEHVAAVAAAAALALERERLEAELRARVEELSESRARTIRFGMAERRRIERDLHDGAQQRLVSLALDLRLARERVRSDPEGADELLAGAAQGLNDALEELRELARGIHPALLSERGLAAAVGHLARRAPIPVAVDAATDGGIPEPAELAAYFVVTEALTNVYKYAAASRAEVRVATEGPGRGRLVVEVADDGVGGADLGVGSGLRGLADRVSSLGGGLEVDSPPGAGTRVLARIPLE